MMKPASKSIHLPWLGMVFLVMALLAAGGYHRISIDTDIVASLPTNEPVIADAAYIFKHHPVKDRIAIDIAIPESNPDRLVAISTRVEQALADSGLFEAVGFEDTRQGVTDLVFQVTRQLPQLFTAIELEQNIHPLLSAPSIRKSLAGAMQGLHGLEGIGQAELISRDPLGLRNLILADLTRLLPQTTGRIYKQKLISEDGKHCLVLAAPRHSGTDTRYAVRIAALIQHVGVAPAITGDGVTLTPVGAYRAALDNETIIRKDVGRALIGATVGIALLLLLGFARPFIGLLALVPALAGTSLAFFIFAHFNDHISIMVLGFGGAIISITVDHGIAFLLFVDSGQETTGHQAYREIKAIGLLAALTSVGAFAILGLSGFPVFRQLGLFTALGIGFSFLFVHTVFPHVLPGLHGKTPEKPRLLSRLIDRAAAGGKKSAFAALILAAAMPLACDLRFNTDLNAMNSISRSTRAADAMMQATWGNIFNRVHLLVEADSITKLKHKNDRLLEVLEQESAAGNLTGGITAARFFPGPRRAAGNRAAWQSFWHPQRIARVSAILASEGARLGFTKTAFDPFFKVLNEPAANPAVPTIPTALYPLLGLSADPETGRYRQVTSLSPGLAYDGSRLYARLADFVKIFDPALFSARLGELLFATFLKMLLIVGVGVIFLLLIFFADLKLTLLALLPLLFSFSCTLGTLGLMGRQLDIPALMLAIIIFGMGVDYTLFMVRAYQRYQEFSHPLFGLTRMAIFMAAASTLVGFGVICGAEHNTLKSAGIISFLGIGYCLIGAFVILPPCLKSRFENPSEHDAPEDMDPAARYRRMEAYPRLFARFKLKHDPMFAELNDLLPDGDRIRRIIDIGCGFGVPGSWLLKRFPSARLYGIEPQPDRVRVAALALGSRGQIARGAAPAIPPAPDSVDLALMLDMHHFLNDVDWQLTLTRIREKLATHGLLVVRAIIPPTRSRPWAWWFENLKMKLNRTPAFYRSRARTTDLIQAAGFQIEKQAPSGRHEELHWFLARPTTAKPKDGGS